MAERGAAAMDAASRRADYDPGEGSELTYDSAGSPITNAYLERLADELERDEVPARAA